MNERPIQPNTNGQSPTASVPTNTEHRNRRILLAAKFRREFLGVYCGVFARSMGYSRSDGDLAARTWRVNPNELEDLAVLYEDQAELLRTRIRVIGNTRRNMEKIERLRELMRASLLQSRDRDASPRDRAFAALQVESLTRKIADAEARVFGQLL